MKSSSPSKSSSKTLYATLLLSLLIVGFIALTFVINNRMQEQTSLLGHIITRHQAYGYSKYTQNKFYRYSSFISEIETQISTDTSNVEKTQALLECSFLIDSSICYVWANKKGLEQWELGEIPHGIDYEILTELSEEENSWHRQTIDERYLIIKKTNIAHQTNCGIIIDLQFLHQQFINSNLYIASYQILVDPQQRCIYHPDKNKIGSFIKIPKKIYSRKYVKYKRTNKSIAAYSDYLNVPAYRVYSNFYFAGENWFIIHVSPGFEIDEIMNVERQSLLLIFGLFMIPFFGLVFYVYFVRKREIEKRAAIQAQNLNLLLHNEKQRSEAASMRFDLLRSGLNSHFMFNSLGSIKALLNKNDRVARNMVSKLSQLYRYQLKLEGEKTVSLKDEFHFTMTFVDIINLRLNDALKIETHNIADAFEMRIVPISIQVLVENAIKHNICSSKIPLIINIEIEDNFIIAKNDLRPKKTSLESNKKGLDNLKYRCAQLSDRPCEFIKTDKEFIVRIPLMPAEEIHPIPSYRFTYD